VHKLTLRVAKTLAADGGLPAADERQWLANADASALPVSLPQPVEQQP
jgi:hypothetical protein